MIDWVDVAKEKPEENGVYLISCKSGSFDSEWFDVARFHDGKWGSFLSCITSAGHIRCFAKINKP